MTLKPVITAVLAAGIGVSVFGIHGLDNVMQYKEYRNKLIGLNNTLTATENQNSASLLLITDSETTIDKYLVNDIIKSAGGKVLNINLLTRTEPVKVLSSSTNVDEIPDGNFYEFTVECPEIPILLKKLDENRIICDANIVPMSNKIILKCLVGDLYNE